MTVATTARYGMGPQGALVHIVHEVGRRGGQGHVLTTWKCKPGFGSWNAVYLDEIGDRVACQRCIIAADDYGERYVYVARVADHVKVGCSNQTGRRLHALGGELLARTPGGFDMERRVLSLIGTPPSRGREWFPVSAEAEILAALSVVA